MQPQIFNFNSHSIRTVTLPNGEPGFVGKDVCEVLGYADTVNAMKQHCRGGVAIHHPILDSLGRTQQARILTEPDLYRLIIGSKLPAAEAFERWVFDEVLPSIRKNGAYGPSTPVTLTHSYTDAVAGMEVVARMLHLEGAAALGLIRKATALTAPHLLPALPVYAIDAPRHESGELVNGGGSEVTVALSTLLKQHNSRLSAVKANKTLQSLGYLEQRTRPSTSGQEVRKFWAVSEAGLKFGKNVTSPSNPKEVQPHWFERTGAELVRQLESA